MIIFQGIIIRDGIHFLICSNEKNKKIEIPIDARTAKHLDLHFDKISTRKINPSIVGNDEQAE